MGHTAPVATCLFEAPGGGAVDFPPLACLGPHGATPDLVALAARACAAGRCFCEIVYLCCRQGVRRMLLSPNVSFMGPLCPRVRLRHLLGHWRNGRVGWCSPAGVVYCFLLWASFTVTA